MKPRAIPTTAMILDSNIFIYAAEPEGAFLSRWVEDAAACLTTVSRIEVSC